MTISVKEQIENQQNQNQHENQNALWSKLIAAARCRNHQLARNLEAFQAEGTRIVKLKNGGFALRPVIVGADDVGRWGGAGPNSPSPGWRDEADYRRYAKKFLAPHHNLLVELLAGLKEESQIALL